MIEEYLKRGWIPIPIPRKQKGPVIKGWQNRTSADVRMSEFENKNVGIVLGESSGGLVDIDLDCREAIALAPTFLPITKVIFGRESKPKSHYIYQVADCGSTEQFQSAQGVLVEYRSTKSQTVFPPSVHPSEEEIRFNLFEEPLAISREELLQAVSQLAAASLLAQHWVEGSRHHISMALAGGLLRAGWQPDTIKGFIENICIVTNDSEAASRLKNVETTFANIMSNSPATGWPSLVEVMGQHNVKKVMEWIGIEVKPTDLIITDERLNETDIGNAERFRHQWGNDVRFISDMSVWLSWTGQRWTFDEAALQRKAQETAKSIFDEDNKDIEKWAKQSCNQGKLRTMLDTAKPHLSITQDSLDTDPHLLNCTNGTVSLCSGELLQFDRGHLITKQLDINFNPQANAPVFENFLNNIFDDDRELINFIQRAIGYSLSGDVSEQCFFIAHGSGANGKSTLLNLISKLMKEYGCTTPMQTLVQKKQAGGVPNDVARLRGSRFIMATEGEHNQHLAASLVKQITGGDTVTARFLNKEFFEFKPVGKLWLATNHKPKIKGDDPAIWRRIHLIPFNVVIPPEDRDGKLPEKLEEELEGILAWAVEGFQKWQEQGLNPPEIVQHATQAYQDEMDYVGRFIAEETQTGNGFQITKRDLHDKYVQWCHENGTSHISMNELGKRLKELNWQEGRSGSERYWKEVRLKYEV